MDRASVLLRVNTGNFGRQYHVGLGGEFEMGSEFGPLGKEEREDLEGKEVSGVVLWETEGRNESEPPRCKEDELKGVNLRAKI
ncbi:hypothetical protein NC651_022428 [Populus alba x Populus x berolinensis]|nr:hypothetical protein NC651_022428 [Populus alba x Populus x berolinensis]